MVSVDGLLDAHEVAVRARVDELRERLLDAERDLEHVVITRNTLRAVIAGGMATDFALDSLGPDETGAGQGSVSGGVSEPAVVPPRAEGMSAQALPLSYREVWLAARSNDGGVRAGELARALGLADTPAKVEGMRSKLKRLAERGWAVQTAPGLFEMT
jgi:hypothetical protein